MSDWKKYFEKPWCNGCSDRAPHFGKICFPLCYRCLGFSVGVIIAFVYTTIGRVYESKYMFLFVFPCLIDGMLQYKTSIYTSNNRLRFLFGFLAGGALYFLITCWTQKLI